MSRKIEIESRARATEIFHEVAALPGYELIDEDTACAIVIAYGKEINALKAENERLREELESLKEERERVASGKVVCADCDSILARW